MPSTPPGPDAAAAHPLAFSTCWNSARHASGEAMLKEIRALGFDTVELSHAVRVPLLPGILAALERGLVRVGSVHNFCPSPLEVTVPSPDCYEFTGHRPADVQRALRLTRQTIDLAAQVGARHVVLHLGRVATMRRVTPDLGRWLTRRGRFDRAYARRKVAAVRERERKGSRYLQRAREGLLRAAEHAQQKNVRLGVEGRWGYDEVPTERELLALLDEVDAPHVGYWHDFGHLQVKENLGLVDHAEWLRQIRPRLLGCHLHDVVWPLADHRAPLTGTTDFARLLPLLPPGCPLVWELSPRQSAATVRESLGRWRERFGPAAE